METTLSDVLPNARWVADGTQTEFTFNFEPLKSEYIKVYSDGELIESGYTLGNGVVIFTTAPASGTVINIMRQIPLSYQEKYENLGILTLETLNHKLVEVTAQLQGLAEKLQRAATAPIDSDIVGEELMESIIKSAATIGTTLEQVESIADEVTQAGIDATANIGKAEEEAISRINQSGAGSSEISKIWATGEDEEVDEIAPGEGEHSSRVSADIAFMIANEEPDVPIEESKLKAADIIRGPRGDTGSVFIPHLDSGILSWTNDGNLENPDDFDFNAAYSSVAAEGIRQIGNINNAGEEKLTEIENVVNDFNTNAAEKQDAVDASAAAAAESADRAEQAAEAAEASTQGGFYNRVHDCILENPRYIIWEQDGNTLTLKAGTKLWYPDGRSVVLESDISGTMTSNSDLVWVDLENNSLIFKDSLLQGPQSWDTISDFPDYLNNGDMEYIISETKFVMSQNSLPVGDYPVPLPIKYKYDSTTFTNNLVIDESTFNKGMIVFYSNIANTEYIFIPQGIKTLACSGLKTDGSYNNAEYITPSIMVLDTSTGSIPKYFAIETDGTVQISDIGFKVTSDNYLQNLSTNEIFSGVRLGNYYNGNNFTNIYDTLDLQNSTRIFYWDD